MEKVSYRRINQPGQSPGRAPAKPQLPRAILVFPPCKLIKCTSPNGSSRIGHSGGLTPAFFALRRRRMAGGCFRSSFRRPTSPARCTSATCWSTPKSTSPSAGIACWATTPCGCRAPTTPASPPRWWWSASSPKRASTAARWAARLSKSASGSGRRSTATPSSARWCAWARAATGRASASRSIPAFPAPSAKSSCACTKRD